MARHKFHGDPVRFEEVADYISKQFKNDINFVADVAGGQGMLSRMLNKRGYVAEVIDPRGWTMVGVDSRQEEYSSGIADYYDLIIGLHPDEALRPVVESAKMRPILVVPCCNFWDRSRKLGRDALIEEIQDYFDKENIQYEKVVFNFRGPHNIGIVTSSKGLA
jgi:hypothetical protein